MANPYGRPLKHFPGSRFGRLVLLERVRDGKWNRKWRCVCDCGREVLVFACNVMGCKTQSCGCLHAEVMQELSITHGETRGKTKGRPYSSEYQAWSGMSKRCYNPKTKAYPYYGGRGITVCDRWRSNFSCFLADVGRKPTPAHTLDRINNDGNYEPGNVRWATRQVQRMNQRRMAA